MTPFEALGLVFVGFIIGCIIGMFLIIWVGFEN